MKANELRIGNYVYQLFDKIKVPAVIENFNDLIKIEQNIKDFKPILLTEKWLLKFGFNKENKSFTKMGHPRWQLVRNISKNVYYYKGANIEYVHQLQNLYFALIQKELKLTL